MEANAPIVVRNFAIFFQPRCGSSWLRSILDSNSNFSMGFELLHESDPGNDQGEILENFYCGQSVDTIEARGFKLGGYQIRNLEAVQKSLAKYNVSLINLYRENLLKTAVSQIRRSELAEKTEQKLGRKLQNRIEGVDAPEPSRIPYDRLFKQLQSAERHEAEQRALISSLDRPFLNVTYEAMLEDHHSVLEQISEFLGVAIDKRDDFKPRKNTPDDLARAVANFDELKEKLKQTEYARFL